MKFTRGRPAKRPSKTTLSFSAEDLAALAKLVAAGQLLVPTTAPVLSRLKAALTRLALPVPKGL